LITAINKELEMVKNSTKDLNTVKELSCQTKDEADLILNVELSAIAWAALACLPANLASIYALLYIVPFLIIARPMDTMLRTGRMTRLRHPLIAFVIFAAISFASNYGLSVGAFGATPTLAYLFGLPTLTALIAYILYLRKANRDVA